MKRHSQAVINHIQALRRSGKSIPEIGKETGLSKATIWHHIQTIVLSSEAQREIRSRQGGSRQRKEESLRRAEIQAQKLVSLPSEMHSLYYTVPMLYWAEGSKRELVFTNTDINMVNLYIKFMIHGLGIKTENIFLLIRISDTILPNDALRYWKKGTRVSMKNIKINHNNIQNKTKTKHGICRVSTRKGAYSLKVIHCMIDAIKRELVQL